LANDLAVIVDGLQERPDLSEEQRRSDLYSTRTHLCEVLTAAENAR